MTRIIHVNINVADLDRSVAFYGDAFSFKVFERQASTGYADGDLRVAYLRADDSPVEIEV
ncbi:MAG: VOC family protein [Alphaproteobacteria bacterium]|nr:VOC family protein [Alphaproteobacteria bacterium]